MVTVAVIIAKVQQKFKVPREVTLSQLIRKHTAISSLPAETTLSWGTVTGRATPGMSQEEDMVNIAVSNPETSRCFVYKGLGQFTEPFEMGLNLTEEPELLAEANRLNPELGLNVQYYQGLERLPRLMPVRDLSIFPREIERSQLDSPTASELVQ
jgi:hypothetical protein